MVNDDLSLFAADAVLTSLRNLSIENLHSGIQSCVPQQLLDAPIPSYGVCNLRYSPQKKMIVGLTSKASQRPISLRIFPRSALQDRLAKAQRTHPEHAFLMDSLNAIAWVFPGERKLNLDLIGSQPRLAAVLRQHRGYELHNVELLHFVPEHTYTARVVGTAADGSLVREYIKIYYNDQGAMTSRIMEQLTPQLTASCIQIPDDISYVHEHRLLIQSEVQRDPRRQLSYRAAASALAAFHKLSVEGAPLRVDDAELDHAAALQLVGKVFPDHVGEVAAVSAAVLNELAQMSPQDPVLVHGDAHLGNLFPVIGGRTGVIDLDRAAWGRADDDLASFLAFATWIRLRDGKDPGRILGDLPNFVKLYNKFARHAVAVRGVYLRLAHKLICERVRRGISRGKISGVGEIMDFTGLAEQCLLRASQYDGAAMS